MSRRVAVIGVAAGAALAYAWFRRVPSKGSPLSLDVAPAPAPASSPLPVPAPEPPYQAHPEEEAKAGEEAKTGEEAESPIAAEEDPAAVADAVDAVGVREVRDTGELEWLLTVPSPRKRRRRTRALRGAVSRPGPLAVVAAAVALLNLAVAGVLATTNGFDAVTDWFSSWLSVVF